MEIIWSEYRQILPFIIEQVIIQTFWNVKSLIVVNMWLIYKELIQQCTNKISFQICMWGGRASFWFVLPMFGVTCLPFIFNTSKKWKDATNLKGMCSKGTEFRHDCVGQNRTEADAGRRMGEVWASFCYGSVKLALISTFEVRLSGQKITYKRTMGMLFVVLEFSSFSRNAELDLQQLFKMKTLVSSSGLRVEIGW